MNIYSKIEDPPGSYAPRSPDLSALASASSYGNNNNINGDNDSHLPPSSMTDLGNPNNATQPYLLPLQTSHPSSHAHPVGMIRRDSFTLPQSSYYQPPPLTPNQPASSYGYSSYPQQEPQQIQNSPSPQNKRLKREPLDDGWSPDAPQQENQHQHQHQHQQTPRGRPGRPPSSKKASKSSAAAAASAAKIEEPSEPRVPAPGEVEGVVVRTKFPVARIKRIVQADDEVGKVAQVTPVAVGKALELFLIHVTLASADIATGGSGIGRKGGPGGAGAKRITSAHIKSAILKHDEFDFLRPIAEKIPDGPAGGGRGAEGKGSKGKVESEEDVDFDMDDGAIDGHNDGDGTYGSRSKRKGAAGREKSGRIMQRGL